MKLESLQTDKFEAFRKNELQNAFAVMGGEGKESHYGSGDVHGTDYLDRSTDNGATDGNGDPIDYYRTSTKSGNPYHKN